MRTNRKFMTVVMSLFAIVGLTSFSLAYFSDSLLTIRGGSVAEVSIGQISPQVEPREGLVPGEIYEYEFIVENKSNVPIYLGIENKTMFLNEYNYISNLSYPDESMSIEDAMKSHKHIGYVEQYEGDDHIAEPILNGRGSYHVIGPIDPSEKEIRIKSNIGLALGTHSEMFNDDERSALELTGWRNIPLEFITSVTAVQAEGIIPHRYEDRNDPAWRTKYDTGIIIPSKGDIKSDGPILQ